jgi:hypothetical protein
LVFRERRSGNVPSQAEFERGNAETEASETNHCEGPTIDPPADLRARPVDTGHPLPPIYESESALQRALFRRVGRPSQDLSEPEWPRVAQELKRKGVTLTLLWQEYRTAHPDGYGYTWFCERFGAYQRRASPTFRHRREVRGRRTNSRRRCLSATADQCACPGCWPVRTSPELTDLKQMEGAFVEGF